MTKLIKIVTALLAVLCWTGASAQMPTTPYSKIGYGLLHDNASSIQVSMGGVGYAMQNGRIVNAMNPASYSRVDSLTFLWDIGLKLSNHWSVEGDKRAHSFSGSLHYITAHFRVAKGLGMSLGLLPYSSVGYAYSGDAGSGTEVREGHGSFNQLYLGAGWEPFKGVSIGANFAYLFGTTTNTNILSMESNTTFRREMELRDWLLTLGLQLRVPIASGRDELILGLAYQPKKSFHGRTWGTIQDSQDTKADTIGYMSLKGSHQQPNTIGAGVSYTYNRQFNIEVDFTYQDWSKTQYTPLVGFEIETLKFDNRWKAAAGMQYCRNKRGSYAGNITYRLGGYYNHDYINITGNNVRDYGLSAGVGLPVLNGKTTINIGLEWKHRISKPVLLIKEDYFNITVGVNFNELWFWKSKIR